MILRVEGVSASFGTRRVLQGLSFSVRRGETVALMGPNGAGKTTLLKCILGLIRHEGTIEIDGLDARARGPEARARLGYVPQHPAFHPMTAREALRFLAALRRVPPGRADEALKQVGLEADADRRIEIFSGGMQQRLSVAAALIGDPPLMLLDEATANLDPAARRDLLALLAGFKKAGKTILLSSHRHSEVHSLADRVILLEEGRVAREGSPEQVFPANRMILSIEAHGEAEKSLLPGILSCPEARPLPVWNGSFDVSIPAQEAPALLQRLREAGVEPRRIRLRIPEEGEDA